MLNLVKISSLPNSVKTPRLGGDIQPAAKSYLVLSPLDPTQKSCMSLLFESDHLIATDRILDSLSSQKPVEQRCFYVLSSFLFRFFLSIAR
jgi:hypothetical protein